MNKTRFTVTGTALAALIALAGCASTPGSDSMPGMDHGMSGPSASPSPGNGSAGSSDTAHNAADVMFAQMMIPHHAQAVEMSDAILAKKDIPASVTQLAVQIKAAQAPEIQKMTAWLEGWNMPVMASSGHAGHGMDGMLSEAELQKLKDAQGTEAAKLYLTQMITHHEGAVAMAKTEIAQGKYPEAIQLGRDIVTSQEREIQDMKGLLAGL
ncbi:MULTISPECIES: DUF305 domain-containing protein [Paenarthrobacter]|jgi:uncharacterized protein (DUF305 family)|uniref:DUF305 domain-containing protein n=1 Tax=Paenarthrobacter TaxID=1742992 RepID=UPI000D7C0227|nr:MULTISPECIES: DUF305 domain-containing protein [Paenarthrobacter]MBP2395630.1 uncharacterized protein (DUF305 family) [Paenarthrobacter nicotinovorans]QOT22740.1 DUF305 domain-containing protein [Paenarthrobacter sp. YJN-D]UKE98253.1 DUF305 domain-containing protein [Paenarthrobacter nicotinovorans]UKF03040.1 DUF305 domain-containing protein [Paenarthrobacter nicotinovorans]GGV23033.1 DUF305 domain-containing protein [Paenarthrobacter nicotinovorans]